MKSKTQNPSLSVETMPRATPAVILAAGASRRLGQPKALLEIGNTTLVGLAYQRLVQAGCSPIVIVTRSELSVDVMQQTLGSQVHVNPTPENGRTGSLQCGLLSLAGDKGRIPKGVIVSPVDRPGWTVDHVKSLMQVNTSSSLSSLGQRGHPIFLDETAIQTVLAAPKGSPLREIVRFESHEVDGPLLGLNIDTPEDVSLLLQHETTLLES